MDKVLEKLGLYDLIGVLLSGIIIVLLSIKVSILFDVEINFDFSFSFLVFSYFIGLIFQELGSKLDCWKILKSIFENKYDLHISLSQKEIDFFTTKVCEMLDIDFNDNSIIQIYFHCKLSNSNGKDKNDYDMRQSISLMARNLFIYFFSLSIFLSGSFFIKFDYKYGCWSIVSVVLTFLFYNRYIRFMKMKYVRILREYYYSNIIESD